MLSLKCAKKLGFQQMALTSMLMAFISGCAGPSNTSPSRPEVRYLPDCGYVFTEFTPHMMDEFVRINNLGSWNKWPTVGGQCSYPYVGMPVAWDMLARERPALNTRLPHFHITFFDNENESEFIWYDDVSNCLIIRIAEPFGYENMEHIRK